MFAPPSSGRWCCASWLVFAAAALWAAITLARREAAVAAGQSVDADSRHSLITAGPEITHGATLVFSI